MDLSSRHRPDVRPPVQPFPSSAPYNHYEQPVPALQQPQMAAFDPYEGSLEFDPFANIPTYLHQDAAMQAQVQLQFESMMYQGAYFPPMYPAIYQPLPQMQMQMNAHPYGTHESTSNESDRQYSLDGHNVSSAHTPLSHDQHEEFRQIPLPNVPSAVDDVSMAECIPASVRSKPRSNMTPPGDTDVPKSSDLSRLPSALDGNVEPPSWIPSRTTTPTIRPLLKSVLSIGVAKATGSHGIFSITKKCPKFMPGCALVMEAIPRAFRNDQFIRSWAKRAAGIAPCYHKMDDKGRVLLVFQSPELAKQAFDSPRLPHGQGKEGIRVWWHRDQAVAGVEEAEICSAPRQPSRTPEDLEEGEIEDIIVEQPTSNLPKFCTAIDASDGPGANRLPNKPASQFDDRQPTSASMSAPVDQAHPISSPSHSNSVGVPRSKPNHVTETVEDKGGDMALDSSLSSRPLIDARDDRTVSTSSHFGRSIRHTPAQGAHNTGDLSSPNSSSNSLAQRSHLPPPPQVPTVMQSVSSVVKPRSPVDVPVGPKSWLNAANRAVPRSTPSPTEPQAMRNLPKGPRSLLARTKELEERLTRSKIDMSRPTGQASFPLKPILEPSTPSALDNASDVVTSSDTAAKLDTEQNLRRLVLQSRKGKSKTASVKVTSKITLASNDAQGRSLLPANADVFRSAAVSAPINTVQEPPPPSVGPENEANTVNKSMEALAISFITEVVQAAESPSPLRQPSTIGIDLAAKQKKLEEHIRETKALIAEIATASTKSEKDVILKTLRERSK